jgi:hypothetical protein
LKNAWSFEIESARARRRRSVVDGKINPLVAFEGVRGNGDVSFRSDTPESASGFREAACQMVGQEGLWIMSNGTVSGDFVAFIGGSS